MIKKIGTGRISLLGFLLLFFMGIKAFAGEIKVPFSTDSTHLTIWNGTEYVPFFMKGINLGIAVPGTFPGQLAATSADYSLWFQQIKDAGFNCIRVYTLHFPRFFEELKKFNEANEQNPLLFLQGVWLEEEVIGYNHDLYSISSLFEQEIRENISAVHGDITIPNRVGKSYGIYSNDVSKWCLGYVVGREIHPIECLTTNELNPSINSYTGKHFSISGASPSEAFITEKLDFAVEYEKNNYNTQRPVTSSSWPTLDPLSHPEEPARDEDTVAIDYEKINIIDAPAGLFVSYHAYPYYPDFVSQGPNYQNENDYYGPNSYLAYLKELKKHHAKYPLIVAEYGVPSSWAIAHYSSSGMNHGGFDEYNQGLTDLRMLNSIEASNCGGGIQFAWIDEWFKRTWVTDRLDYLTESRILWHNIAAAEQNYGLVKYDKILFSDTIIPTDTSKQITYVHNHVDYTFYELELGLKDIFTVADDLWITFDTFSDTVGESILPNGDTIPTRSEFALHITKYSAELFVTEAYDVFGIWFNKADPKQLFHPIKSDGKPWNLVKIKNNVGASDIQYIGNLQVNYDFQPVSSEDAVTIFKNKIKIKIPWFYLNVVAPDQRRIFFDDRNTAEVEDTVSDGFSISVHYKNEWHTSLSRSLWDPWVYIGPQSIDQHLKKSYYVMKDNLMNYNTSAIAYRDSFVITGPTFPYEISEQDGLLKNDFDIDGNTLITFLDQAPKNGKVLLSNDGSFNYSPDEGFNGYDSLSYLVYDGSTLSQPNWVVLEVTGNVNSLIKKQVKKINSIHLMPNPVETTLTINGTEKIKYIQLFSIEGILINSFEVGSSQHLLNVQNLKPGVYFIVASLGGNYYSERFIKK